MNDDTISRQAAINAFWKLDAEIRPSAINAIIDMIRTLPSAETPKRTGKSAQNVLNDDLVSRKAAIDSTKELTRWYWETYHEKRPTEQGIIDMLNELPSAQPERKNGKWTTECACEFCGFQPWYERDIHTLSYCPNCGAEMRGGNNEID